ncbi:MAG: sigma-54-dependent transcriptional regulator [Acidobacteriota bacterium]
MERVAERLAQLLFIDEQSDVHRFVRSSLGPDGYEVFTATNLTQARTLISSRFLRPEIVFVEPHRGDDQDRTRLREALKAFNRVPVVVLSSFRDPKHIVEAVRAGAADYICKPVGAGELEKRIREILRQSPADSNWKPDPKPKDPPGRRFVCCNPQMEHIRAIALQVAEAEVPVLILGESGVGKDVIASLIHQSSCRRGPFVRVNCAAMPAELTESELFGCEKGAYTGAHVDRPGKFEFAHQGTIFLDEVAEFTPSIQAKLLQVLQEGTFTRLGSNQEIEVDVHVIAATNRKLDEAIAEGRFREDLYYRLNVVNMEVPPLRRRKDEIRPLCDHFLEKFRNRYNAAGVELPAQLLSMFEAYHWPGNVRELENIIKRYLVLQDLDTIRAELEAKMTGRTFTGIAEMTDSYLEENQSHLDLKEIGRKAALMVERKMILSTLRRTNWNKSRAASELKVSYKTLLTKIQHHDLSPERV